MTLTTGVMFAFFMIWFLGAIMPKIPFYLAYVIGGCGIVITNMMNFTFLEPAKEGFGKMFALYWLQTIVSQFTQNLP